MKRVKDLLMRMGIVTVGLALTGFGAAVFILLGLGSDPTAVFNQGMSRATGFLSIGQALIVLSVVLAVPLFIYNRKYISVGSVMHMFLAGIFIDIFMVVMQPVINEELDLVWRLALILPACAVTAYGVSLYIMPGIGAGPVDLVAIVLTEIFKKFQFRWVRVGTDLTFVVLGFLLGGTVGIGTVVFALIFGHFIQIWNKCNKKLLRPILEKPEAEPDEKEEEPVAAPCRKSAVK